MGKGQARKKVLRWLVTLVTSSRRAALCVGETELEKPSPELLEDSCCLEGVEGPS